MQLAIRHSWSDTAGTIICQIRLTEEERDLADSYNLNDTVIWSVSSPFTPYTLTDFMHGINISKRIVGGAGRGRDNVAQFFLEEDKMIARIDEF